MESYVGQNKFQKAKRKTARIFLCMLGQEEKEYFPDRRIMSGGVHDVC